jgi:hypothetical protein
MKHVQLLDESISLQLIVGVYSLSNGGPFTIGVPKKEKTT